jgi:hypothetical protein
MPNPLIAAYIDIVTVLGIRGRYPYPGEERLNHQKAAYAFHSGSPVVEGSGINYVRDLVIESLCAPESLCDAGH